jgi:hypothetical protein
VFARQLHQILAGSRSVDVTDQSDRVGVVCRRGGEVYEYSIVTDSDAARVKARHRVLDAARAFVASMNT